MRAARKIALGLLLLGVSGCGQFFKPTTSGSSGGSGGGTGGGGGTTPPAGTANFLYVLNEAPNVNSQYTLAGFSPANSNLALSAGSPYQLPAYSTTMSITPSNSILYVGEALAATAIYAYAVNFANGSLSVLNSNNPIVTGVSPQVIKVDPTGNWLIEADYNAYGGTSAVLQIFQINPQTGGLSQVSGGQIALDPGVPTSITYTPNGGLIYVSLATGGMDIFSFNTYNGALAKFNTILPPKQAYDSINGLAVDPTGKYLFAAETGISAVRVLTINANGSLAEAPGSPVPTGLGPTGVLVDKTGAFVYVTNRTDGTVSAFSLNATTGALTALAGSPFASGYAPISLAEDNTKTYLAVVNSGGFPDLRVFTINATTGVLSPAFKATTGTDPTTASVVVATH